MPYRVLIKGADSQRQLRDEADVLSGMRQKILDLEKDYVQLNQQFIAVQAQLREVVSEQRYKLVESINTTRARTSPARQSVALADREPANAPDFLTKLRYGEQGQSPMKSRPDGNSPAQALVCWHTKVHHGTAQNTTPAAPPWLHGSSVHTDENTALCDVAIYSALTR